MDSGFSEPYLKFIEVKEFDNIKLMRNEKKNLHRRLRRYVG
ncbi:hypothetical protein SAMN05444380_11953 [Thermophagus xiamenensis]|uniref:Uncharacterized protein n=1 Tax=Thermophagus xiamenensis TaxID=385682 RepID=A0A1I2DMF3_9BACT|nr:hypothetical protein SAMN05444380_11953 [Thermophagus xiamenensis]